MRLILKIILFPISLILSILTAFLTFLLGIGTALLHILMTLCVFVALGSFFYDARYKNRDRGTYYRISF